MYFRKINFALEGREALLYVTDDRETAQSLRSQGEAVVVYLHPGNREENFSAFLFAVEDPEDLEAEYVERVYRRLKGMPWNILETERCLIRETTPEDVEDFYRIYSHPSITKYMEGLYPEVEAEKAYVREYIEKVYTFFGFGIWTVVEKAGGAVIGRAGFSYREGFQEPELGSGRAMPRRSAAGFWTMAGGRWSLQGFRRWWSREIPRRLSCAGSWAFLRKKPYA